MKKQLVYAFQFTTLKSLVFKGSKLNCCWNFYEVASKAVQGFFRWEFQRCWWVCDSLSVAWHVTGYDFGRVWRRFGPGGFGVARKSIMKISKKIKRDMYKKWLTTISASLSGSVEISPQNRLKRSRCRVRGSCSGKRLWSMSRCRRKWRHYKDFGWLTS